jgi:perosamine synthetase
MPLPPSELADEIREALLSMAADGSWCRYEGSHCERLRNALRERFGVPHVTLCCSGTIAVELALRGVGVGVGDEVILAGYDFPGNFRAIEAVGARPVLADIEPDSWCLDADRAAEAIGPATRAIIFSHLHGTLASARRLRSLADARGLVRRWQLGTRSGRELWRQQTADGGTRRRRARLRPRSATADQGVRGPRQ